MLYHYIAVIGIIFRILGQIQVDDALDEACLYDALRRIIAGVNASYNIFHFHQLIVFEEAGGGQIFRAGGSIPVYILPGLQNILIGIAAVGILYGLARIVQL